MKIALQLVITIFFFNAQSYCLSQTIKGVGDTNISIDELLAAGGVTNAIRCDAYLYSGSYLYTNDEDLKAHISTNGINRYSSVKVVDQKTVFAIVDSGVYYYMPYASSDGGEVRFSPFSQIEKILFVELEGIRYASLVLID